MRTFSWVLFLLCPFAFAHAENVRLIYFELPPLAKEEQGKAGGPAVDLLRILTAGLPVSEEPVRMPVKRLEHTLETEQAIAVGLGRIERREAMGLVWIAELFRGNYYFVTLRGHPPIRDPEEARTVKRIACNLGSTPAEILKNLDVTNIDYAADLRQEAAKLHEGRVDGWFDRGLFIDVTWRSLGYDAGDLIWSAPVPGPSLWVVASPKVSPAIIQTMRARFDDLKAQGKLDRIFTDASW